MKIKNGVCRCLAMALLAALSLLPMRGSCAVTNTYAFSTTGYWGRNAGLRGDGLHFSDTNNWNWGDDGNTPGERRGTPVSSLANTNIRLFMYGVEAINDWPDDYMLRQVQLTELGPDNVISGNALNLGSGGIYFMGRTEGVGVATQRLETVVRAASQDTAIAVPADYVLEFLAPLTYFGEDMADRRFNFSNSGTVLLRGGMNFDRSATPSTSNAQIFGGSGDYLIESDVYAPRVMIAGGAHVAVRNGAKFETWTDGTLYSYYQQCTVDVEDGYFLNCGKCYSSDGASMQSVFNVKSKGFLDTGAQGLLLGHTGYSQVNVYDGGKVWYRNGGSPNLCGSGHTDFNIYGGEVHFGNDYYGNGTIRTARGTVSTDKTPSTMNLMGGEIFFSGFHDWTGAANAGVPVNICLDGVTFRHTASGDMFNVPAASATYAGPDRIHVYMREGGCTLDTREFEVMWQMVPLRGNDRDGGTDGDLVKLGSGTLIVNTSFTFAGNIVVKGGVVQVRNGNYISGGVDLRPSSKLTITGNDTTLSLNSFKSKSGIVRLLSGQSLLLASAPVIDGRLVFDFNNASLANGTRTLITAPGMTSELASCCAVQNFQGNKSVAFSVDGNNLVMTVADGTRPATPVFPAGEDSSRIYGASGTRTMSNSSVEKFGGAGTFNYTAVAEKTFAGVDIRVTGDITLALGNGAGDVTIAGLPVKETSTANPTFTFSSGTGNAVHFVGDWSWSYPYTNSGFTFARTTGNFIYGPELQPTNIFQSIVFHQNSSHTVCRSVLALEAMTAAATAPTQQSPAKFVIDGGTVKVAGVGDGSLDDFLGGATDFAIGADGGTFDTCGHDATVTQTLAPTGAVSGTLTKTGDGTLTFAASGNVIHGALAVSNGTLVAAFDTSSEAGKFDLDVAAGATWNMNGSTAMAKRVSGSGTIANGTLVITERLVSAPGAGPLAVDGLSFGAGGTIDLGCSAEEHLGVGQYPLVTFAELDAAGRAALRTWDIVNKGADQKDNVRVIIKDNALVVNVMPDGAIIILR